jgi:DNA repair protein RecO
MHHIHRTKSIIIKNQPLREADKRLTVLTDNLGLVKVTAAGVRKMESKLRQSIQDYSLSDIALVAGKAGWRLTNAKLDYNFRNEIRNSQLNDSILRALNLIDKLVVGESSDTTLFDISEQAIEFAKEQQDLFLLNDQIKIFEIIFVLKILYELGYLDKVGLISVIDDKMSWHLIDHIRDQGPDFLKNLIKKANNSIRESGL